MKRPLLAVCIFLLAVVGVRLSLGGYERPPEDPFYALKAKTRYTVTGQICKKENDTFWIHSESILSIDQGENSSPKQILEINEKFICKGEGMELPMGSFVVLSGIFSPYERATNPGEFDAFRYYRSIGVSGSFRNVTLEQVGTGIWPIREAAYRSRRFLQQRIVERMPADEAALMSALLLGDKTDLDPEQKELYKRNGILHILSISSLHITFLGMTLYRLLRRWRMPVVPSACIGAACLLFYGAMVGFSVSACRAIGMFLIRMLAEILGRTYDCLTALGLLAAIMTIYRPFYLENVGFLLSFASVAGIGVVLPILTSSPSDELALYRERHLWRDLAGKVLLGVRASALASLSITLTTLPIQLFFYYEVPIWSVLINLLVLPFVKPLIILGVLCLLPFGTLFSLGPVWILQFYTKVCLWFDGWSTRTWNPGRETVSQLVTYYCLLSAGLLLLWREKRRREKEPGRREGWAASTTVEDREKESDRRESWAHRGTVGTGILCMMLAVGILGLSERQNRLIFLDVGQGNCVLLQTASGEAYLYDCGSSSRTNVGRYVLLPALKYYGINRLEGVFLSHADNDHMNGIAELFSLAETNHLQIAQMIFPGIDKEEREKEFSVILQSIAGMGEQFRPIVTYLSSGQGWKTKAATFRCVHPVEGTSADNSNAYSMALAAQFDSTFVLLVGDVETDGEQEIAKAMTEYLNQGDNVLLQVAHHGSKNATAEEFLRLVQPKIALISAGRNNRYGHPHKETLRRLEASGCTILRTDELGAIVITVSPRGEVKKEEY